MKTKTTDTEYSCVILNSPKPVVLRSGKFKVAVSGFWVENFSVDESGKTKPSGIRAFIPTRSR